MNISALRFSEPTVDKRHTFLRMLSLLVSCCYFFAAPPACGQNGDSEPESEHPVSITFLDGDWFFVGAVEEGVVRFAVSDGRDTYLHEQAVPGSAHMISVIDGSTSENLGYTVWSDDVPRSFVYDRASGKALQIPTSPDTSTWRDPLRIFSEPGVLLLQESVDLKSDLRVHTSFLVMDLSTFTIIDRLLLPAGDQSNMYLSSVSPQLSCESASVFLAYESEVGLAEQGDDLKFVSLYQLTPLARIHREPLSQFLVLYRVRPSTCQILLVLDTVCTAPESVEVRLSGIATDDAQDIVLEKVASASDQPWRYWDGTIGVLDRSSATSVLWIQSSAEQKLSTTYKKIAVNDNSTRLLGALNSSVEVWDTHEFPAELIATLKFQDRTFASLR